MIPQIMIAVSTLAPVCADPLLDQPVPEAPTIILILLEKDRPEGNGGLPIVGISETSRILVPARVEKIERGTFKVAQGRPFLLAVHSVALSFGYDYVGESYRVGLDVSGSKVRWLVPASESLVRFVATVIGVSEERPREPILLSAEPHSYARVEVTVSHGGKPFQRGRTVSIGVPVDLALGHEYCFSLLARGSQGDHPFRLVHLLPQ